MTPDQIDNAKAIMDACHKLAYVQDSGYGIAVLLIGTAIAIFLFGLIVGWQMRGEQ